jgi:subtilisin family serine protease
VTFSTAWTRHTAIVFGLVVALGTIFAEAGPPSKRPVASSRRDVNAQAPNAAPPLRPLSVHRGQVIDPHTGRPSWLVLMKDRPAGSDLASPASDRTVDEVLAAAGIGADRASHRFRHALVGFAADLTPLEAARIAADPRVLAVDPNRRGRAASAAGEDGTDLVPPWPHRRISNPEGDAASLDRCGATGSGVTVVVIDTGVNPDHTEVAGRVTWSVNTVDDGQSDGRDGNGHGTAVASIAAGRTIGVAPDASIAAIRALDDDGTYVDSWLLTAIDWTVAHADDLTPAVVNMSLGATLAGQLTSSLETALDALEGAGLTVFAAGGNDSKPSSWESPAASIFVGTIGACDGADHPSPFSNFGPSVDLWAPGSSILAADWLQPDGGLLLESGTSEATPIVAGVAALHLQLAPPTDEERANAPRRIAHRIRLSLLASAAPSRLSDRDDPIWVSPGGNAILGGAANLLLQSCPRTTGIEPGPLDWHDGVAGVRLGDGLSPIPLDFSHSQFVNHPDGPLEITIGLLGLPRVDLELGEGTLPLPGATVRIIDMADDRVLFDSDSWIASEPIAKTMDRVVRSSTSAGVRIDWRPAFSSWPDMPEGVGYAMTAAVVDPCPGELTGDGVVDGLDLQRLLVQWGACPVEGPCVADLDSNGVVNAIDLGLLFAAWGTCPVTPTRGFLFDCDGREVLRNHVGDTILDDGSRAVRVGRFGAITAAGADLDCPALDWDTDGGAFTIAPDDPRPGACLTEDGCSLATATGCPDGVFFGAGVECGPSLRAWPFLLDCGPDSIMLGFPWVQPILAGPNVRFRQPLLPGTTSISAALFMAYPSSIANSTGISLESDDGNILVDRGLLLPPTPFRVTIEFADGGPPLIFETQPATEAVTGIDPSLPLVAYRFGELLPAQSREIRSIEFAPAPAGLSPVSSTAMMSAFYGAIVEEGSQNPPVEISRDGGRTWSAYRDDDTGQLIQWGMCLIP